MNRPEAVAQLKAVWSVLSADVDAALAYGRQADTPYAQRALVRAHFALVEGLAYQLRQVTLASLQGTGRLSSAELALLNEQRYSVDEKGHHKTSEQFLRFPQSLLFSIRSYVKNHGADYEPDTRDPGWAAMRSANEIRNRVTHPKSAETLRLSEADLKQFVDAAAWWRRTMFCMFAACEEADEYWRGQLSTSE